MLLKDLSPNKIKTIVRDFFLNHINDINDHAKIIYDFISS